MINALKILILKALCCNLERKKNCISLKDVCKQAVSNPKDSYLQIKVFELWHPEELNIVVLFSHTYKCNVKINNKQNQFFHLKFFFSLCWNTLVEIVKMYDIYILA